MAIHLLALVARPMKQFDHFQILEFVAERYFLAPEGRVG